MPELPEVETVRRGLAPVMEGRRIARVTLARDGLRWPFPPGLATRLTGARVTALGRRSKYLLAGLDTGETLILHLGMSGRLLVSGGGAARASPARFHHAHPAAEPHDHVRIDLDDGSRITFNDPRRFGAIDLTATDRLADHPLLAGLGPEPLGNAFSPDILRRALAGRRTSLKAALLDQHTVAGLGNIYVCEALWRAFLSPRRLARSVGPARALRLHDAIRAVLADAIAAGGASLRDYRQADGELGYFQHAFAVYDRAGAPCPRPGCTGTVRRIVQTGRSTFHCPTCQR
jgi:formamidopyrimidine-DNA glycosylase